MTKFLIQFSLILCISILADDHIDADAKFSECQGKVANYYLSNLVDGGSVEGWLKAAAMHEKYYTNRGFEVEVLTEMQYSVDEDGNVSDKFVSLDTCLLYTSPSPRDEL